MTLQYHPHVQTDLLEALAYYEAQAGRHIADRFEAEFRGAVAAVAAAPARFPPYLKSDRLRRIRLASFPFVVVYREHAGTVRVLLLKHELSPTCTPRDHNLGNKPAVGSRFRRRLGCSRVAPPVARSDVPCPA